MAAVVVLFDRAARVVADLPAEQVRRRARLKARTAGCTRPEILAVDSEAAEQLRAGDRNHDVIERCEQLAKQLVRQRTQRGGR